jgi:transposase
MAQETYSAERIAAIHARLDPEAQGLIEYLLGKIRSLEERQGVLETRLLALEGRLGKTSRNSHRPSGSEPFRKGRSPLERPKGLASGGQKGHPGHRLEPVAQFDHRVVHTVCSCAHCGQDLSGISSQGGSKRQVFDLPVLKVQVTEHETELKSCPSCGGHTEALFPSEVSQATQYGPQVKALATYFMHQHFISSERTQEVFRDVLGCPLSEGSLYSFVEECGEGLVHAEETLREILRESPVVHFDETGLRVNSTLHWVHSASTSEATLYTVHPKRGKEGMEAGDVLPHFEGVAIHDGWKNYWQYECGHGLCDAHIVRELTFVEEKEGYPWAGRMKNVLLTLCSATRAWKEENASCPEKAIETGKKAYEAILTEADAVYAQREEGKQRSKGACLLDRLWNDRDAILAFTEVKEIPFTNNQAEQDIRMVKVKQKVSGSFRTFLGATLFCRIRSVISTVRKNKLNVLETLTQAIRCQPVILRSV